jgi:uncharacterized membrane-anchored protein
MRSKLVLLLILCQLLVLGFMAAKREHIRAYGTEVYLRTAPVDPRDPLRGDYVSLRYAISSIKPERARGAVAQHRNDKDYPVYAVLKPYAGIHVLDYLSDEKPSQQDTFIKGYISDDWRLVGWTGVAIGVRYGIEQYFVEQGHGLEMEEKMGQRDDLQIPLDMRLAIGADGTAVIKDYRWSTLGIKLEMLRISTRNFNTETVPPVDQPLSPKIKLTLKNVSMEVLTLADPEDHCGFSLVSVEWASQDYPAADKSCDAFTVDKKALITLQPEQEYAVELELSEPRWHVIHEGKAREIGALPTQEMFRVIYRAPADAQIETLGGDGHTIWRGELPSRAFNASGQVD